MEQIDLYFNLTINPIPPTPHIILGGGVYIYPPPPPKKKDENNIPAHTLCWVFSDKFTIITVYFCNRLPTILVRFVWLNISKNPTIVLSK